MTLAYTRTLLRGGWGGGGESGFSPSGGRVCYISLAGNRGMHLCCAFLGGVCKMWKLMADADGGQRKADDGWGTADGL